MKIEVLLLKGGSYDKTKLLIVGEEARGWKPAPNILRGRWPGKNCVSFGFISKLSGAYDKL